MFFKTFFLGVADLFKGKHAKPSIILLSSTLLMVTWKYYGAPGFYQEVFGTGFLWWQDPASAGAVYSFVASLVMLGVIPALIIKYVFKESLADYGLKFGERRFGRRSLISCIPIFLLVAFLSKSDPGLIAEYPINKGACLSQPAFGVHALTFVLFYLGWEFHFRGFLQFGLEASIGPQQALWVQVMASTILHIGKPGSEIYGAILGGILWGFLAIRTRSLLYGLIMHIVMGLAVDWLICF